MIIVNIFRPKIRMTDFLTREMKCTCIFRQNIPCFHVIQDHCCGTGPEGYIILIFCIPILASVGALSANRLLIANYTPLHSYLRSSIIEGSDDMSQPFLASAVSQQCRSQQQSLWLPMTGTGSMTVAWSDWHGK